MKCYRKNGSDRRASAEASGPVPPSMKCYRKNGSDVGQPGVAVRPAIPSMKCYRKNGSDTFAAASASSGELPQ